VLEHPERGLLRPKEFLPTTEETRLILPIGKLILNKDVRWQGRAWHDEFPDRSRGCGPTSLQNSFRRLT
jgi:EAL domain-containing protein (putative c-di-GMP-specific phosphodiesterase class I)